MHPSDPQTYTQRRAGFSAGFSAGFTLVELSIVIIILSLLTAGGLAVGASMVEKQGYIDTKKTLEQLEQSLKDFYVVNGRLPCVARMDRPLGHSNFGIELGSPVGCTAATTVTGGTARKVVGAQAVRIGMIPVRTLGLTDAAASDKYGNRILYAVTEGFSVSATFGSTIGAITIRDGAVPTSNNVSTTTAYVILSHGRDRRGGRLYNSNGTVPIACGTTSKLDVENCNWDTGADEEIFRDAPFNNGSQDNFFYDDLIRWAPSFHLLSIDTATTALWAADTSNPDDNIYSVGMDGDPTTGAVGIGTGTPRSRLDVVGGLRAQTGNPSGDGSNVGYAFADDGDTGMFRDGPNSQNSSDLTFFSDNVELVRMAYGGNVGIGVDPEQRLDVNGNLLLRGDGANRRIYFYNGNTAEFLQLENWQISTTGASPYGEINIYGRQGGSGSTMIMAGMTGYNNNNNDIGFRLYGGGNTMIYSLRDAGNNYTAYYNSNVEKFRLTADDVVVYNGDFHVEDGQHIYAEPDCQQRTSSDSGGSSSTATASCQSDEYMMSGGGNCTAGSAYLTASFPSSTTQWRASCTRTSAFGSSAVTAYAICCEKSDH